MHCTIKTPTAQHDIRLKGHDEPMIQHVHDALGAYGNACVCSGCITWTSVTQVGCCSIRDVLCDVGDVRLRRGSG